MITQSHALSLLLLVLILHAALACVDVLLNHELIVKLPRQASAMTEQWLHSARELVFALIFAAIAWMQWHGHTSWFIVALLSIEFVITTIDTVVEVETRKLPISERINHVLLYINFGAICLLSVFVCKDWYAEPTLIQFSHYGAPSWILSLAACGSAFFCVRDAAAAVRLGKMKAHARFTLGSSK